MNNNKRSIAGSLSRREFIQTSAAVTGAAAIAGSITLPFSVQAAPEQAAPVSKETIKYSACLVNCGSRCPLKVHVKNGEIVKIANEAIYDDSTFGEHQIRPCLRGRSVRWKTYNPDRVKYPMLRVGKRGEGKFKRISWDEATTIVADNLKKPFNNMVMKPFIINMVLALPGLIYKAVMLVKECSVCSVVFWISTAPTPRRKLIP